MIGRTLTSNIRKKLFQGKAIILLGPRQTGKTTLLKELTLDPENLFWLNGDESDVQTTLSDVTSSSLKLLLGGKNILVIDEAQRIENIGLKLKLITDNIKDVQVIATGSSSFDLANRINEPLTGRKWEYQLFPISFEEMVHHHGLLEEKRLLKHRMVYGYYPEIITKPGEEKERLKLIAGSYLYKDVLEWERILKSEKLVRLLQALAHQLGSQVSYHELGQLCGLDSKTVEKYIDLLEKAFVIFRLGSFSRNLRNELKNSRKIYFYDNGIRNAIINNFTPIELRSDVGALWENFLIAERYKISSYHNHYRNTYFWRTLNQQEIDLIEEYDGKLHAYEFKWNSRKKVKLTKNFQAAYPDCELQIITPENFEYFVLPKEMVGQ